MVIHKKIARTMFQNKSQYLGSILLIILSCLLFTAGNQLSKSMSDIATSFKVNNVQEDAHFVTGNSPGDIQELEAKFNAKIEQGASVDYSLANDKTIRIFRENTKVNIPAIIEGKSLAKNEIFIDPAFAKANQLQIGSKLILQDQSFTIAGLMSLPDYIYPLKSETDMLVDSNSFGVAVLSKEDFAKFDRGNVFYSIKFNDDRADIDKQGSLFRDYLLSKNVIISQWSDIRDNKRVSYVSAKIESISKMGSTMPIAILLLTCILVGVVVRRLLHQESAIIGTLYALGYKKREIYKHYFRYPLTVALSGGIIGTLLGTLVVKPMLAFMISYFNMPTNGVQYNISMIAASLLLPLLFLGVSCFFVLRKELRYSPVDLMRGTKQKSSVNFIERKLTLEKLKFPAKFRIREQLRSLPRLAFLLIGVALASMLLLLGFTIKSSVDYLMKDSVENSYHFEYEYLYNSFHQEAVPPNTEAFSASTFITKSDSKSDFYIGGINPDSTFIFFNDQKGAKLQTNQVIITKPLASKLLVSAGDTIEVISKLDAKVFSVTIACVADSYIGEYIFMPIEQYNTLFHLPSGSYMGLWSKEKLAIPEDQLYSAKSIDDSIKAIDALTKPLQATIGVIAFFAFIIGLIVIHVVTSLIIEENRGNISLMKIFGYRKKDINSLILNSSSLFVVVGYLLGIPLILVSMNALYKSVTASIHLTMPVMINYTYILVGFVVVFLTYELSKAFSRKKVNKIAMSEALKAGME